ncbi:MAG: oligosaccharide flippase family protein [Promethearchaeota archaeon]
MLARKSILIFITSLFSSAVYGFLFIFAVKTFSSTNFGNLAIANSLFAFFIFFTDFNFMIIHIKKMAEQEYDDNSYFSVYFILKMIFLPITSLIMWIIISFQINQGLLENNQELLDIIQITFVFSILSSINLVFSASFQAKMNFTKMQIGIFIGKLLRLILALIVIFTTKDFVQYVFTTVIEQGTILIIYLFFSRNLKLKRAPFKIFKSYIIFGSFLIINQLLNVFIRNYSPFVYLLFYNDLQLLGVYQVIMSFLSLLVLIQDAFRSILLPNISSLFKEKNFTKLKEDLYIYEKYMMLIWGIIAISSFTTSKILINFFLGSYYFENGAGLFYIAIYFSFSWAIWSPYSTMIVAIGKMKLFLKISSLSFGFIVISWFIFIPLFNIIGLDLGRYLSFIPNSIYLRSKLFKEFKVGKIDKKVFSNFAVISIFLFLIFSFQKIIMENLLFNIFALVMILSVYISILLIVKIIDLNDVRFILHVINPKMFIADIKKDLSKP